MSVTRLFLGKLQRGRAEWQLFGKIYIWLFNSCPLVCLQYDEKAMVDAVARLNPVSFAFEVVSDFMHYKEGVYTRWAADL